MRALLVLPLAFAVACPASAAELALRRVMLSSGGVGYFEYEAAVEGAASLGLDVRLDQVDDVLKSLVVFDAAGGVGAVTLPGRDGEAAAFGDVPFGREGLQSPRAYLEGLRGVEVLVEGPRPMQGRVLAVDAVREPGPVTSPPGTNQPGVDRTRVSLLTPGGLRQFVLEDAESVQVADPALRERIGRALDAARRLGARDARRITVSGTGTGARTMRVGFVAGAPLWKASYRLVLPPADADPATAKARLQGWATLENVSGSDWSGVSLSLQYGNPVTFRQAIYRSYYVQRPEVPVEVLGRLLPDVDTRARTVAQAPRGLGGAAPVPPPPPPPAPMAMAPALRAAPEPSREAMKVAGMAEAAAVAEGQTETVFALPNPVDLPAGHSASVPILDVSIPAVPVALAKPGDAHPLAAIRLLNDSGSSLPAGVLTLYDATGAAPYAGDARLGGLPAGESRLVSYAQDLRTGLAWRTEDTAAVASLSAAGGVLAVDRRDRQVTHVTLTAPERAPRRVLVEVPRPAGGTVAEGFARPVEETAGSWRFAADLKAGETRELVYAVDQHERQSIELLDDEDAVAAVLNLQGASPAARAALERIAALRREEAARTADRDRLVAQRDAVDANQARVRANLAAVQPTDALRGRLLRQLDADETRRGQLDGAVDTANAAVTRAHAALADAIAALRF